MISVWEATGKLGGSGQRSILLTKSKRTKLNGVKQGKKRESRETTDTHWGGG